MSTWSISNALLTQIRKSQHTWEKKHLTCWTFSQNTCKVMKPPEELQAKQQTNWVRGIINCSWVQLILPRQYNKQFNMFHIRRLPCHCYTVLYLLLSYVCWWTFPCTFHVSLNKLKYVQWFWNCVCSPLKCLKATSNATNVCKIIQNNRLLKTEYWH